MEVLKHGITFREKECPECAALLSYCKKDIKKILEKTDRHFGQNVYTERKYIKCPECGAKIYYTRV